MQEFTVTDDTVLEEHLESPETVQMKILGEGGEFLIYKFEILMEIISVVQSILRGKTVCNAERPRRSRASACRAPGKVNI